MIKSIETYCSLYLEKFKNSYFKSGIYQTLFHPVTVMEFAILALNPQVSDLECPWHCSATQFYFWSQRWILPDYF